MATSSSILLSLTMKHFTRNPCLDGALLRFSIQKDYIYASGYLLPTLYPQDTRTVEAFHEFDLYRTLHEDVLQSDPEIFFRRIVYGPNKGSIEALYTLNKLADRHVYNVHKILKNRPGYEGYDYTEIEKRFRDIYTEYMQKI